MNTQKHTAPTSDAISPLFASEVDKPSVEGATIYKGHKFRIYPNKKQRERLDADIDACRFIYNLALETKIYAYRSHGVNLSAYELQKQITDLKKDHEWLRSVSGQSLEQAMIQVKQSFNSFFNGGGFPKFKRKSGNGSATYRQYAGIRNGKLNVTKCAGIKIILSRQIDGETKSVTISRTITGKYFASVLVQCKLPVCEKAFGSIGIDLGLSHFATLSDGNKIDNPRMLQNSLERIKCLQRRVSRKKNGSANRKKAIRRLALAYEHVTNKRKDFLHKASTRIVRDSQVGVICVEDLAVSNMIKNHNLAQAISDVSWHEFVRLLQYKCEWSGKQLVKVDRFYPSSKTCSDCGLVADLRLSDRVWTCECGATHDRDINAAINIQKEGLRISGKGIPVEPVESSAIVGTVKQECYLNKFQ